MPKKTTTAPPFSGLAEIEGLATLADNYAREIMRSPFDLPFDAFAGGQIVASGWYPSYLLNEAKLKKRPVHEARMGLLVDPSKARADRARIEGEHRGALMKAFAAARDTHPTYKHLCNNTAFKALLSDFADAGKKSPLTSPLRAPNAEAQFLYCAVRPLWRLQFQEVRWAPTKGGLLKAKRALQVLQSTSGVVGLPSLLRFSAQLPELLRDLDAELSRLDKARAQRADHHAPSRLALAEFRRLLSAQFGARVAASSRLPTAYARLLGFKNPRAAVSS